jgi:hypothetical protein
VFQVLLEWSTGEHECNTLSDHSLCQTESLILSAPCIMYVCCRCCAPWCSCTQVLLECIIQEYHHLRKAASSSSSTALGDAPDSPSSCSDGGRIKAA